MSYRNRRIALILFILGIAAAVYVAGRYETSSRVGDVNNRVARIESPCLKASEEPTRTNKRLCRESFEKAIGTITHPEACAVERKAGTLKALRELAHSLDVNFKEPCKGARLAQERKRGNERRQVREAAGRPSQKAGDANSAPTGSSRSGRHEGGSGSREVASHGDGHKESPEKSTPPPPVPHQPSGGGEAVPSSPSSSSTSEHSSGTSTQTTERTTETTVVESAPEAPAPVRDGLGAVVESVGGVVEETGASVNEVVGGVQETTCQLAKVLCH